MTEQVNKAEQNVIKNELLLTWEKVSFLFGTIELTIITLNLIVDLLTLICWNNKKLNTISCELLILLTKIYFLHLRTSQSECFLYLYWPKLLSNNPLIQSLLNARNSSILSCSPLVNLGFHLIAHVLKTTWFIWKAIRLVHHSLVVSKSHISLLDSGVTTMLD